MIIKPQIKNIIIEIICMLFVLLFIYAAVTKLLDFENFQVQLGQSPVLSGFEKWISWTVPLVELVVAFSLFSNKWRYLGFIACLGLIAMFTAYIFIVLHFSSFVPCSCGGILEKMSWNAHLIFNLFFVLLAIIAILFKSNENQDGNKMKFGALTAGTIGTVLVSSVAAVFFMFLYSEDITHYKNPFVRRYVKNAVELVQSKDLKFNSYYLAGSSGDILYLGNYTTPLFISALDTKFKNMKISKIQIDKADIPFRSIKISVRSGAFYLMDGTIPIIYSGSILDFKIRREFSDTPRFLNAEPIDSISFIFRNNNSSGSSNIIGTFYQNRIPKTQYMPSLLQKQIDGIFDTDGILHYDALSQKMAYVYFYRNEIIIADKNGKLLHRGHTIDTIKRAQIKVANLKNNTVRKMAAPPLIVNSLSVMKSNLLFVESKVKGLRENEEVWKNASIIDVYNIKKRSYVLSFPIFRAPGEKIRSMHLTEQNLYVLMGNHIRSFSLKDILKREMINESIK